MSRRRRNTSSFRSSGYEAAIEHIREYEKFKQEIGGGIDDVERYFFTLNPNQRNEIFLAYGKRYGESKEDYARKTLTKWQSGRVHMSGLVAKRLFSLLPNYMPLEMKYQLTENLWKHVSPKTRSKLVFDSNTPTEEIIRDVRIQLDKDVIHYSIPDRLKKRFEWLSGDDIEVKQQLLNFIRDKEKELSEQALISRLPILTDLINKNRHTTNANHIIEIGRSEISIELLKSQVANMQPTSSPKGHTTVSPRPGYNTSVNPQNNYPKPQIDSESSKPPWIFLLILLIGVSIFISRNFTKETGTNTDYSSQSSKTKVYAQIANNKVDSKVTAKQQTWAQEQVNEQFEQSKEELLNATSLPLLEAGVSYSKSLPITGLDAGMSVTLSRVTLSGDSPLPAGSIRSPETSSDGALDISARASQVEISTPHDSPEVSLAVTNTTSGFSETEIETSEPAINIDNDGETLRVSTEVDNLMPDSSIRVPDSSSVDELELIDAEMSITPADSSMDEIETTKPNIEEAPEPILKFIGEHRNKVRKKYGPPIQVVISNGVTHWVYEKFVIRISDKNLVISVIPASEWGGNSSSLVASSKPTHQKSNEKAVAVNQDPTKYIGLHRNVLRKEIGAPAKVTKKGKTTLWHYKKFSVVISSLNIVLKISGSDGSSKKQVTPEADIDKKAIVHSAPSISKSPTHVAVLSDDEERSLEYACSSAKHAGPATYRSCKNKQLAALSQAPKIGTTDHLIDDEKRSLEYTCTSAKHNGPSTYRACINKQLELLAKTAKVGNKNHLSAEEKRSLKYACTSAKHESPSKYRECQNKHLKLVAETPKVGGMGHLTKDEKRSLEYACTSAKHTGPSVYRNCQKKHLKLLTQAPKVGSTNHLTSDEKMALEYACTTAKHKGPSIYRNCKNQQLRAAASVGRTGNINHLTGEDKRSLKYACSSAKHSGPAAYRRCISQKIGQLK